MAGIMTDAAKRAISRSAVKDRETDFLPALPVEIAGLQPAFKVTLAIRPFAVEHREISGVAAMALLIMCRRKMPSKTKP
jgi:hypothetical protein